MLVIEEAKICHSLHTATRRGCLDFPEIKTTTAGTMLQNTIQQLTQTIILFAVAAQKMSCKCVTHLMAACSVR